MKVLLALAVVLSCVAALNITKTLVVLDNKNLHGTHSQFFKKLEAYGTVEYAYSYEKEIKLKYYDEYLYERLVLMCTSQKESQNLKVVDIVAFYDSGRSVVVVGDIDTSRTFRKMFYSFGLEMDEFGGQLKDNFNNLNGKSTSILTSRIADVYPFITQKLTHNKLAYRGTGFKLPNFENNQLFALVRGEPTTYSRFHTARNTQRVGSDIVLVASVQGLNNARAIVTGSLDLFSDEFYAIPNTDNSDYTDNVLRWCFKQSGLLRATNAKFHSVGQRHSETLFTVTQKVHYQIDVQQWDTISQSWRPYVSDDLAVEFVMLDPWVITRLTNLKGTATYAAEFVTPTKQGIYQFKFIYEKPGYNFIAEKNRVTLRTKKHDEFERFLLPALPYYTGTFATVIGSLVFVLLFIYSKDGSAAVKEKTN